MVGVNKIKGHVLLCYAPRLLSIGQLSILQNNYHFGSPSSIDKNVSVFIKEGTKTVRKPLVSLSQLKLRWRVVIPFLWATSATATKNSSFDTRGRETNKADNLDICFSKKARFFKKSTHLVNCASRKQYDVFSTRYWAFTNVPPVFPGSTAAYEAWQIEGTVASAKVVQQWRYRAIGQNVPLTALRQNMVLGLVQRSKDRA